MTTEINIPLSFHELQDLESLVEVLSEKPSNTPMSDFWPFDVNSIEALTQTTSMDSTPSSPQSFADSSPLSDFIPPFESSSDEEQEMFPDTNGLLSEVFGGIPPLDIQDNMNILSELSPYLQQNTKENPFSNSCLPPLPVAETVQTQDKGVKKRRRTQRDETVSKPKTDRFFELSQEELLKLDSAEIETYIKELCLSRSVSPAEEKELKRIRRLIKNREYAQSSRNKRKQHTEDLQQQLNRVTAEKSTLEHRVAQLELDKNRLEAEKLQWEAEKKTLQQRVSLLQRAANQLLAFLRRMGVTQPLSQISQPLSQPSQERAAETAMELTVPERVKRRPVAVGSTLLVVFLAVALWLPSATVTMTPGMGSSGSFGPAEPSYHTGRVLLGALDEGVPQVPTWYEQSLHTLRSFWTPSPVVQSSQCLFAQPDSHPCDSSFSDPMSEMDQAPCSQV